MIIKKKIGLLLTSFLILINTPAFADVYVHEYTKKDGTHVKAHYRSDPDGNFNNNWSTKGNINPHTGKEGTKTYPENSAVNGYNEKAPTSTSGYGYNEKVPVPTTENGYDVKVPTSSDFEQLVDQRKKDNEEMMQKIKEQTEKLEKEREEIYNRSESQRVETEKQIQEIDKRYELQRIETEKQIQESLKELNEIGKSYTPNYTPYESPDLSVVRSQNTTSSNVTNNEDYSVPVHEIETHSKQTFFEEVISFIKNLFK
jgi:hypothetical protein